MTQGEEIRPCPFCGNKIENRPVYRPHMGLAYLRCNNCDFNAEIKTWNSAWCWTEIDSLVWLARSRKKEIERMRKAIETCAKHWELVAGSSAFRLSGMAGLLKTAMGKEPESE